MRLKLSSFLQLKINVFFYRKLGWDICLGYILVLGKLYYLFNRKERDRIAHSVEYVFKGYKSDYEIKKIKKNIFRGIFDHYFEKIYNAYENIKELSLFFADNIKADSLYKLDEQLEKGKGIIFVTGHYGAVEYIPIFLGLKGYPITVIVKFATKQLEHESIEKTKDMGIKIINAGEEKNILGHITKELKSNRIVFIECDEIEEWKPSKKSRLLFLRKSIGLDRTIDIIQRRTGAATVFGIMHRYNLRQYRMIIRDSQDMLKSGESITGTIGEKVLKSLEELIYRYPEEWYQWKNYAMLQSIPIPDPRYIRPKSQYILEPVLSNVS